MLIERTVMGLTFLQVDTQEYAFAMRKNSPWLDKINWALTASIDDGVITKSYAKHLKKQCPPFRKSDKPVPLTLDNLGSLFSVGIIFSILLALCKVWPTLRKRNRPQLPMRSITVTNEVISRTPSVSRRTSAFSAISRSLSISSSVRITSIKGKCRALEQRSDNFAFSNCECGSPLSYLE